MSIAGSTYQKYFTVGILVISVFVLSGSRPSAAPGEIQSRKQWVDSVFETMSLDQKIGQLFMVAAYSNRDEKHYANIDSLVSIYHLGGLIFMQGGPVRQATLTNRYQSKAKIPLFISIDGEWGLAMRLDSTVSYPRQMTLGAIKDVSHIYDMGAEIARQCRRIGIHIDFAPVVDVNSNPANPVIGFRSFGESKEQVAARGIAYMKGLQDNKVLACAKHFPGHGNTDTDSHHDLPVINNSKRRMDEIELYPFRKLIKDSLASVMVAHIHVPAYDDEPNKATTLSENVVTDLLKGKLDFEGLVFTDALNMKGVSKYFKPGEVDVKALLAGNDVLLFSENVPIAIEKIKEAIEAHQISEKEIDKRVKKI
ncbi:MAG: glycosyl hydrolase, partial [Cytophagales bacterium]|nr:glycosyl hydrolase [Cytophagales bacterium]